MTAHRKQTHLTPSTREHLVSLDVQQTVVHPRNMRRVYPLRDVRRMGLSQLTRMRAGETACVQPVIVARITTGKLTGKYMIVAGHLRRAGNLWITANVRPRLNCLVRPYANESAMLSDMSAENGIRADVGPVSWAIHYRKRLADGVSEREVARECGVSIVRMRVLIELLQLTDRVQVLLENGDIKITHARTLLRVEHAPTQVKLALRVVQRQLIGETLEKIVKQWLEMHSPDGTPRATVSEGMTKIRKPVNGNGNGHKPTTISATPATEGLPVDLPVHLAELRVIAAQTCATCDIGRGLPGQEQAWHIALAEAGQVCRACELKQYIDACRLCPLAQMMTATVGHFVPVSSL